MALRLFWFGLATAVGLQLAGCNGSDPANPVANTLQATPSMQSAAGVVGGNSQTLSVTFVSTNNEPITNLSVSGLGSLPSGWSGPATFSCSSVTTGSGCVLNLSYEPSATGSGTLALSYSYTNAAGATMAGTLSIPFSATSKDNVIATASPTGQVTAVIPGGSQPVTVTFTTDDGQAASGLTLTSSLSSLPAGWSSGANAFSCATVSTGNGCQLSLTFAPQAAGSGTLTLNYSYTDDAGEAKTGTASIAYAATTDDSVAGAVSPSGQVTAVTGTGSTNVTVSFATDDGNPAGNLTITAGLASLPSGWSGPSSFDCSTVSAGTACQLPLTYAPASAGSGTLTLTYSYNNDAGEIETGAVNIPYLATPAMHAYLFLLSSVEVCDIGTAGALSNCVATASGPSNPQDVVFDGSTAYVSDQSGTIWMCTVNADGTLTGCSSAGTTVQYPGLMAINGAWLYLSDTQSVGQGPGMCVIGADGALGNCSATDAVGAGNQVTGLVISGSTAYLGVAQGGGPYTCTVGSDGSLSGCGAFPGSSYAASGLQLYQNTLYSNVNVGIQLCVIGSGGGTPSSCSVTAPELAGSSSVAYGGGIAIGNGLAYFGYAVLPEPGQPPPPSGVAVCAVAQDGTLSNCEDAGYTGSTTVQNIRLH